MAGRHFFTVQNCRKRKSLYTISVFMYNKKQSKKQNSGQRWKKGMEQIGRADFFRQTTLFTYVQPEAEVRPFGVDTNLFYHSRLFSSAH